MKNIKQSLLNLNVPNTLTTIRITLIPIFVLVYCLPFRVTQIIAGLIFFIAGATDYLDGYLARYLGQSSRLGEFLDPVADKLLVTTALVLLVADPLLPYISIPAAIIIGREIAISALREWMADLGQQERTRVNWLGKVKTFFQMLAIFLLILIDPPNHYTAMVISYVCLYIAAALTLYSMYIYLHAAYHSVSFHLED